MIAEIKRAIEIRAQNGDFSGAILIAKDDRILLNVAYGYADREAKILNTTKTQFHLASVGKMFTAAAIATLVKKGKISFTDTVGKLLPDFPNREIAEKVRVHHLLTHSAGLGTFFESSGFNPRKQYRTATEEVEVYKNEPLFFEPGAKMRYSNAGYSLLGAIIERVSGKTYLEYVRENVFKPLGMIDTGTNSVEVPATGGAVLYQPTDVDPFGLEPYNANRGILRSQPTGFGGGFSTSADLFKFARAYNTGKFLGQELTETMIAAKDGRNWGYGIVESKVNGETVRGHSGGGRADVAILWNSGYTVIVQTNATPPPAAALSSQIVRFITKQLSLRK
jgi:CubicO group peptidase (beta-lactamase class C family)